MFHLAAQVCLYSAQLISFYLAGPVPLQGICFCCVLLGRPQGHRWSTPVCACPMASFVVQGFASSYRLPAIGHHTGGQTISVLLTLEVM